MLLSKSTRQILILAIISIGLLGYSFIRAAWTAPTTNPPANNVTAPINVGATYQAKTGDLGAVRVRAGSYCDASGANCFTATELTNSSKSFHVCTDSRSNNVNDKPCYNAAHPQLVPVADRHYRALMCLTSSGSSSQTTGESMMWNVSQAKWAWFNRYGNWHVCGDGAIVIDTNA